jgi:hypothetical protein
LAFFFYITFSYIPKINYKLVFGHKLIVLSLV